MSESEDSFDDDDVDFNELFNAAARSQHTKQTQQTPKLPSSSSSSSPQLSSNIIPDPLVLKGENAVLRAQLQSINHKNEEEIRKLKEYYNSLLQERNSKINALNDGINKFKEDNEFLTSENKTLTAKYIRPNKKRRLQEDESFESSKDYTSKSDITKDTSLDTGSPLRAPSLAPAQVSLPAPPLHEIAIINQISIFQDEKSLLIENIYGHVIPGMTRTTLDYLSNISSSFDFQYNDFSIKKHKDSFKTSIVNYLISFQNKNRIDLLLSNIITILLTYCKESIKLRNLLSIPFLLSLIQFLLSYKSKAISQKLLESTTLEITSLLYNFQHVLKQDIPYLNLVNNTQLNDSTNNDLKLDAVEKTMHTKILEVFSTVYILEILETLSKLSLFFEPNDNSYIKSYWSIIPKFLINHGLSVKTPIQFVFNTIEILISSTTDTRFCYNNTNKSKPASLTKELNDILDNLISLLNNGLDSDLYIYGLNRIIGSNVSNDLLHILIEQDEKITSKPVTHSFDTYSQILNKQNDLKVKELHTNFKLTTELKILQLFEFYFSLNSISTIRKETLIQLVSGMVIKLGNLQEFIYRLPRSKHIPLIVKQINLIIKLIHYIVSFETDIEISDLPNVTLREMVIALTKISSNSIKTNSISYMTNLRTNKTKNFKYSLFNKYVENKSYELYSIENELKNLKLSDELKLEQINVEIQFANGLEISYIDETIDLAREIISLCLTGDEADQMHYAINYDNEYVE
ncbi:hypothetical protein CANARDRAFT_213936 [[Candida] arabinofermentans NRRL YB-2248]|uniref:DNA damage checkpoint protein LCD1 n=1 Tax=[Candida] arabinofermentans NRRL YB-2248 TaxID=983967 RepID=A0A1E4SX28_9ASCO|nr:hypothetical protein CANARDRAFT_213936 [[Candida] arabinofermentans NRRL YB-2248]